MSNRTYTAVLNDGKGAPAFMYIYDANLVTTGAGRPITGANRLYTTADISNNTVNVSGLNLSVGNVAVTGGAISINGGSITVVNPVVPVSGTVFTVDTGVRAVNVTNPILAVSGSFQTSAVALQAISGYVTLTGTNLSFDSTSIVNALTTGNQQTLVADQLLSGISGRLGSILPISGIVNVSNAVTVIDTGIRAVNITNSAPLPVSGVVTVNGQTTITNPIGVTGTKVDLASIYTGGNKPIYNFVAQGGRVTNPSGDGSVTGSYNTGDFIISNYAPNGGLYVNQGQLDSQYDSVTAFISGGNITPVFVTGTISTSLALSGLSFDSTAIVLAQASGNNYLASISGRVNTIVPISGVVQTNIDNTSLILALSTGNNLQTAANALINISNSLLTGISGLLATNLDTPASVRGEITGLANTSATVSSNTVSGLSAPFFGTVLPSNTARKGWFIENLGTGALMVRFSASMPTTGNLHVLLKGASGPYIGDGASWTDMPAIYTGPVSVSGIGGAPCIYNAWEI